MTWKTGDEPQRSPELEAVRNEALEQGIPEDIVRATENWGNTFALLSMAPEALIGGWWAEAYFQYVIETGNPIPVKEEMIGNSSEIVEAVTGEAYESYFDD